MIGGARDTVCGVKLNCAPPVDSPQKISQQTIATTEPVGDFPCAQQAISSQSPWLCIGQAISSPLLRLLPRTSMPHAIPPASAWQAMTRTIISAAIDLNIIHLQIHEHTLRCQPVN